ncbi:MAG: methyl-accepting chemotaxis protein [Kiloniellaceae bacterium]
MSAAAARTPPAKPGLDAAAEEGIDEQIQALRSEVENVANMAKQIEAIAKQTNLLALNATIEAARAGDAGRGFAVVAGEVKQLAGQTSSSTAEIAEIASSLTHRIERLAALSDQQPQQRPVATATPARPAVIETPARPAATEAPAERESAGDSGAALAPRDIELVRQSFARVEPVIARAGAVFYQQLFQIDPSTRSLFEGDMTEQGDKFMAVVKTAIAGLDKFDQLIPVLKIMGQRHLTYGIGFNHYESVGTALLATLNEILAENFTGPEEQAWATVYAALAEVMMTGAQEPQETRDFS